MVNGDLERQFQNEEFLLYRLSAVGRRVSAMCADRYLSEFGLSVAEWRLLAQVGRFGSISGTEISQKISMDKVAISRAANKCMTRGLIKEVPVPLDRRSKELTFTAEGRRFYSQFLPRACELATTIESGLTKTEARLLKRLLKKLNQHLLILNKEGDAAEDAA
jgi:DNA-binding MarR family transcriptional regulator